MCSLLRYYPRDALQSAARKPGPALASSKENAETQPLLVHGIYEAEAVGAAQAYIDGLPIFTEGAYGWAPAYCGILLGALGLSAPLVNFSVGGLASRGLPDRVITARQLRAAQGIAARV